MAHARRSRLSAPLLLVGLSIAAHGALGGCTARADAEIASAEGRTVTRIAVAAPGPLRIVSDAFGEVPLDAEQRRAVTAELAASASRHAAVVRAMRGAAGTLAAQVEGGKVDRAALRPAVDAVSDALAATQPADRAAIDRLHRVLDIEQRQLLIDRIEERIGDGSEQRSLHDKWELWKAELGLTEEQRDAIAHDVIGRVGWEWGAHWGHEPPARELLEAFVEEDDFAIDEVADPIDVHAAVAQRAAKVLDVVEAALPHLSPAQRKIAAAHLRRSGDTDLP